MNDTQCEVYVECASRTIGAAEHFLSALLPHRSEAAEEYPYPELSDAPKEEFADAESLMVRLQEDTEEPYGIYWHRIGPGIPLMGMLFYTSDGGLIAGAVTTETNAPRLLETVAACVEGRFGYVTTEERPPDLLTEFRERCIRAEGTRLIDGLLHSPGRTA